MISAIVLAAGLSRRMGTPKINLPWPPSGEQVAPAAAGARTVLGQVVITLVEAGLEDIRIVIGPVTPTEQPRWADLPVTLLHNPRYAEGEMLSSLQVGLAALPVTVQAALVVLGDQPYIQAQVVRSLLAAYAGAPCSLVIPSYRMHRGHPWLLPRPLWDEVLSLAPPLTLRDFLQVHAAEILYVPVDTPTILQDLDTPADYRKSS